MPSPDALEIMLDFETARQSAEKVRRTLINLRNRFDLAPFEYTKRVRIAPLEISRSHPVLTLDALDRDELGLLSVYLHEQMHRYVVWYYHAHTTRLDRIFAALRERYPKVPVGVPDSAPDEFSAYLHLIINWLEIEVTAQFYDRDRVLEYLQSQSSYRWIYLTVVKDWEPLATCYRHEQLLPLRRATEMSPDDLRLAALGKDT